MAKAPLTDGLLSVFPAADACPADLCVVGNLFLQQVKTIAAPAHTVGWIGDFGVGMVHMKERLCFRSGVRPGKRHLQDVERG